MGTATGASRRRLAGRRTLRISSLTLGAMLSMHCRVTASSLSEGFFMFLTFLIISVAAFANPLRHFEVYLGQWSISGPGRAFRIVPMLDGIGIAICINAIVRAICCCTLAAITALYVYHSVSDQKLPFTYCRNFELTPYEPKPTDVKDILREVHRRSKKQPSAVVYTTRKIDTCNETYSEYPLLHITPAYNFFYVEVVKYRSQYSLGQVNVLLAICVISAWAVIWAILLLERCLHGRMIWNNMYSWFIIVPWLWATVLVVSGIITFINTKTRIHKLFRISNKEIFSGIADALEVAIYIHAAGVGTEIIHGKGLNRYASGHIDPILNTENVWHSAHLLMLTALHTSGAMLCSVVDFVPSDLQTIYHMREGIHWIIPMYSKCTSHGHYSHFVSTIIFSGLVFSYMTVAFVLLKTALHTIFEYRVKLVFVEQYVVAVLILTCMGLSLIFATNGGIALLDSIDAIMNGIALPFICFMELICLLYISRSHDFVSDMNIATEENLCASRIGTQWQLIPFIVLVILTIKAVVLVGADIPFFFMYIALAPLFAVIIAIPMRAAHNAYVFLKPSPRHGI